MKFDIKRWVPSVFIAFVFIQSLFFKFSGSYETQYIFGTLGVWSGFSWFGVYGAYLVGGGELVASLLLLSKFWPIGALGSLGVMSGAIFFHLFTPLGIVMPQYNASGIKIGDDGGLLFSLAVITWSCALGLAALSYRRSVFPFAQKTV
jgi:hypothetical protein